MASKLDSYDRVLLAAVQEDALTVHFDQVL